eukprot:c2149_g1_i1.p2 GENE.c2149_g1_i1~~c2149_g1_i1.p2  ORF type:complete len:364 (-),score=69.48 c2149_g1_i1:59-1150(-)
MALGMRPHQIILANPCKPVHCLLRTKTLGVTRMTFDNKDELEKIASVFGPTAELVIRISVDDSKSMMRFGTKFGTTMDRVASLLARAQELGMTVIGVSFHVGSGCQDPSSYDDAIARVRRVFDQAREYGFTFKLLDLGGGFPGSLRADAPLPAGRMITSHRRNSSANASLTFEPIAQAICAALDNHFPASEGVTMIGEPGRYFAQSFTTIFVDVFSRRVEAVPNAAAPADDAADPNFEDSYAGRETVAVRDHGTRFMYYVDDGIYQSFNSIMFDHAEPLPVPLRYFAPAHASKTGTPLPCYKSTIFGPTCDSIDCIGRDVWLEEMRMGETLVYFDAGAYTRAAASNFNGMSAARPIYVKSYTA